jgi:hypothetical protein
VLIFRQMRSLSDAALGAEDGTVCTGCSHSLLSQVMGQEVGHLPIQHVQDKFKGFQIAVASSNQDEADAASEMGAWPCTLLRCTQSSRCASHKSPVQFCQLAICVHIARGHMAGGGVGALKEALACAAVL